MVVIKADTTGKYGNDGVLPAIDVRTAFENASGSRKKRMNFKFNPNIFSQLNPNEEERPADFHIKDHIQSVARLSGEGQENILVFTRSARTPGKAGIYVVPFNDIQSNGDAWETKFKDRKTEDFIYYEFDDVNHAGGVQALGSLVFVANDCDDGNECNARIEILDLNDPFDLSKSREDRFINRLEVNQRVSKKNPTNNGEPRNSAGELINDKTREIVFSRAAAVAVTRLQDGRYFMFVGGRGSVSNGWFYVSDSTNIRTTTWNFVDFWDNSDLPGGRKGSKWNEWETINFIPDRSGDIYMVAMGTKNNKSFLYRLTQTGTDLNFEYIDGRGLNTSALGISQGLSGVTTRFGAGTHITPDGNLVSYVTDRNPHRLGLKINQFSYHDRSINGKDGDDILIGTKESDVINGKAGNDFINGKENDDFINGGFDNDTIYGGRGNDDLDGFYGNDLIRGWTENDLIFGDAGNDSLHGDTGIDTIYGGNGNDLIFGHTNTSEVIAQLGEDYNTNYLYGGNGNDTMHGNYGNDYLYGEDGNDLMYGKSGNDYFHGGNGNDLIIDSDGNDILYGGGGNDGMSGGSGDDTLDGGANNDYMNGDAPYGRVFGNDRLYGGMGNDTLRGNSGNDTLYGGSEDDKLLGEKGNDSLHGGTGDDSLLGAEGDDWLDGWDGNDTLSGNNGNDEIHGGAGQDNLLGGTGEDRLFGWDGNDTVHGGPGNDWLEGGNDKDILRGSAGNDTLLGGEDNDFLHGGIYYLNYGYDVDHFDGGSGNDTVSFEYSTAISGVIVDLGKEQATISENSDVVEKLISIENIIGTERNDTITGDDFNNQFYGRNGKDRLFGKSGNDTLAGENGDDNLYGGHGDDSLIGGSGNDYLRGDAGADILDGGAGIDRALFNTANAGVNIDLSQGIATTINADTGVLEEDTLIGIELIRGSYFGDRFTGDASNNVFNGEDGDDTLRGGIGNDSLSGDAGADILNGGEGIDRASYRTANARVNANLNRGFAKTINADTDNLEEDTLINIEQLYGSDFNDKLTGNAEANILAGFAGDDTLIGGNGNDLLTGHKGADAFVFTSANQDSDHGSASYADRIGDFNAIEGDKIHISASGFGGNLTTGLLDADYLVFGTTAIDSADRFIYNQTSGSLSFDADGSGAIEAIEIATLHNRATLSHSDFVIF